MKRRTEQSIGQLVNAYLREEGLESPLNEFRLLNSWSEVMGKVVARYTGQLFIRNEVLYVEIKSAPLKADLLLQRSAIVEKLNGQVGFHVIKDLKLI